MTRRPRPHLLVLVVALALSARLADADRAAAEFLVQRGEKAQRERKWGEAQQLFQKALEEDESHLPARSGLAEALYAAGDRAAALETWRLVASAGAGGAPVPPAWAELVGRAKVRVADLDTAGAAFDALLDRQTDALVELSARCREKDADVAARALERALRLRPRHPEATAALRALGGGTDPAEWTALFDGKEMAGFLEPDPAAWKVVNGVMIGDVPGKTYLMWSKDRFHGDFDVRMEARITATHTPRRLLLLCAAMNGKWVGTQGGLFFDDMVIRESDGPSNTEQSHPYSQALSELPPTIDVTQWTTYHLQLQGSKVRLIVNGTMLAERDRVATRLDGTVGLLIQDARVEVRRFQALQR